MDEFTRISVWQCASVVERSAIIVLTTALALGASPVPIEVVMAVFQTASPLWWQKRYDAWRYGYGLDTEIIIVDEVPVEVFPSDQLPVVEYALLLLLGKVAITDPPCRQRSMPNLP